MQFGDALDECKADARPPVLRTWVSTWAKISKTRTNCPVTDVSTAEWHNDSKRLFYRGYQILYGELGAIAKLASR